MLAGKFGGAEVILLRVDKNVEFLGPKKAKSRLFCLLGLHGKALIWFLNSLSLALSSILYDVSCCFILICDGGY